MEQAGMNDAEAYFKARIARRKRPLDIVLAWKLDKVREAVNAGAVLTGEQEAFLKRSYEWNTDPARIKWK